MSATDRWISSVGGGALLAIGLRRGHLRSPLGAGLLLGAGYSLYRGLTGHDRLYTTLGIDTTHGIRQGPVHAEHAVTINATPERLYQFWHNFENLPRFMRHLKEVRVDDDRHSHWVAKAPAGTTVAWDAEITEDRPNTIISWRSLPGADVENSGSVRFRPAPGGRGTTLEVVLAYVPPAGALGAAVAKLFGEEPTQQLREDLRRFKSLIETGEIPTTTGQPSGKEAEH
jgi:uncharacterized membrane protein